MLTFIFCLITLFLLIIELVINHNTKAKLLKKIPGPKNVFIFGNALRVMLSPVELFKLARRDAARWNGIYRFWAYPRSAVNVYNPEDIEKVISTTKHNEKSTLYRFLRPWLQEGLLLSSGSKWYQRRKILTPTFHFKILRDFFVIMEENGVRLTDSLMSTEGKAIDIVPILSEFTLNSICETAMGTQLSEETNATAKSYKSAIYELGKLIIGRVSRIYYHTDFIFNLSATGKRQNGNIKTVHSFTKKVIRDRKEYIEINGIQNVNTEDDVFMTKKLKKTAMLDVLIMAHKDHLIDDNGIQEEVDTFMFEGHDTTASGLTFCLLLLANNKCIQDKIFEELKDIFDGSSRSANFEDLSKMRYLECCIKESMRLYPPVPIISRAINGTLTLSNYEIPTGTYCNIHIYDLHRRADLFESPLDFNPDRFLPDNCIGRHPYAYIPFSAGPRNCIGQKFAIMEMKVALSAIIRKFELLPVTRPSDLEIIADLVLRNSKPIYVSFVTRNKNLS